MVRFRVRAVSLRDGVQLRGFATTTSVSCEQSEIDFNIAETTCLLNFVESRMIFGRLTRRIEQCHPGRRVIGSATR